jgi:HSP20 family protein
MYSCKCRVTPTPEKQAMRTLVNLNPASEYRTMEEVFDRLFGSPTKSTSTPVAGLPIDVTEREGSLVVRAAVPGVEPSELDIQIEKNVLTIRGESRHDNEAKDEKVYRREVSYGAFARSIRLPEGLDLGSVNAEFRNGIVTITLPRLPEEKPQSIKVNIRSIETPSETAPA